MTDRKTHYRNPQHRGWTRCGRQLSPSSQLRIVTTDRAATCRTCTASLREALAEAGKQ